MRPARSLLFGPLFLLGACRSAGLHPVPAVLSEPEFAYRAGFRLALDARPGAAPWPAEGGPATATLSILLLGLDAETAAVLEGAAQVGPKAWTTNGSQMGTFVQQVEHESLSQPSLVAQTGRWNTLSISSQRAYVADFELKGSRQGLIADPVVEVFSTGIQCKARTELQGEDRVAFDFELRHCGEIGTMRDETTRLPGFPATVTVQKPQLFTQELATHATLAPDECLVLSWNDVEHAGRRLFAIVTAARPPVQGTD